MQQSKFPIPMKKPCSMFTHGCIKLGGRAIFPHSDHIHCAELSCQSQTIDIIVYFAQTLWIVLVSFVTGCSLQVAGDKSPYFLNQSKRLAALTPQQHKYIYMLLEKPTSVAIMHQSIALTAPPPPQPQSTMLQHLQPLGTLEYIFC